MKNIVSILIIITFLCQNKAFAVSEKSHTLRPPIQSNEANQAFIENQRNSDSLASNQAIDIKASSEDVEQFEAVRTWLTDIPNFSLEKIDQVIDGLKNGIIFFRHDIPTSNRSLEVTSLFLRRGRMRIYKYRKNKVDQEEYVLSGFSSSPALYEKTIPEDVRREISQALEIELFEPTIILNINNRSENATAVTSKRERLWKIDLDKMTDGDIGKYLRSLGKDVSSNAIFKQALTNKLIELQKQRPETTLIVREKALELLEIDEDNFKDRLKPFVGDYIALKSAIRTVGMNDDTAEFYRLFDAIRRWPDVDIEEAKRMFSKAMDRHLEDTGKGEKFFRTLLGLDNHYIKAWGKLGISLRGQGKLDEEMHVVFVKTLLNRDFQELQRLADSEAYYRKVCEKTGVLFIGVHRGNGSSSNFVIFSHKGFTHTIQVERFTEENLRMTMIAINNKPSLRGEAEIFRVTRANL